MTEEIRNALTSGNIKERQRAIAALDVNSEQEALDMCMTDPDPLIRWAVAEKGYGLKKLSRDENSKVRLAVAWACRLDVPEELDIINTLIDDKHFAVRQCIAKKGYALDRYITDPHETVRAAVAWACDPADEKGREYLDKLVGDRSVVVRVAVAKTGYALGRLFDGKEGRVLKSAERREVCRTIVKMCDVNNPDHCAILDKMLADSNPTIRGLVMVKNYKLNVLAQDEIEALRRDVEKYRIKNKV